MAAAVDPKTVPTAKLNSGYSIPLLGWGTFSANDELGTKSTHTALEAGYRVGCLEGGSHCLQELHFPVLS